MLTTEVLDPERGTSLDEVLTILELPAGRFEAQLGMGRVTEVVDLGASGVRVKVMPTASIQSRRAVARPEGQLSGRGHPVSGTRETWMASSAPHGARYALNIFDRRDFLSYIGVQVFPDPLQRIENIEVNNRRPFPQSHGAYWSNDQTWKAVIPRLP